MIEYSDNNAFVSPARYNLMRYASQINCSNLQKAYFCEKLLEFNDQWTVFLEDKARCATWLSAAGLNLQPETWVLTDDNAWSIMDKIGELSPCADQAWILKPALLNNGEGIHLLANLDAVKVLYQTQRRQYAGTHVLQHYIAAPHLLQGHKYTIRLFVVVTQRGEAFLYRHGYFNVASRPYQPGCFSDASSHLTNEHLVGAGEPQVHQIPTHQALYFDGIYKQLEKQVRQLFSAWVRLPHEVMVDEPAVAFFGVDFLLDERLQSWLLEVNHGPCFPVDADHPLQAHLYDDFWLAVLTQLIQPLLVGGRLSVDDNFALVSS